MDLKRDEIYDGLKKLEILLEKSFPIIPLYLYAVKVEQVNKVLKQIYDCIPEALKNTECSVYNLLKQFEFLLNNSFPILPNYLVAVKISKLEQIIDRIYSILPGGLRASESFSEFSSASLKDKNIYEWISILCNVLIVVILIGYFGHDYIHKTVPESSNNLKPHISADSNKKPDEPNFGPYMKDLQKSIKANWNPPKGNESKRVIALFKVGKDGKLLDSKIFKTSGVAEIDSAALEAIKLTSPFRPLPSEFKGKSIDIQFTFDYNVLARKPKL